MIFGISGAYQFLKGDLDEDLIPAYCTLGVLEALAEIGFITMLVVS